MLGHSLFLFFSICSIHVGQGPSFIPSAWKPGTPIPMKNTFYLRSFPTVSQVINFFPAAAHFTEILFRLQERKKEMTCFSVPFLMYFLYLHFVEKLRRQKVLFIKFSVYLCTSGQIDRVVLRTYSSGERALLYQIRAHRGSRQRS